MSVVDTSATGMQAQQLMIDVISHNLANINTNGFKRQVPEFKDLLYINRIMAGMNASFENNVTPQGIQLGLGAKLGAIYRVHEQGSLQETGNRFDLAIKGDGYFRINLDNGEFAYTRDGAFTRNKNGEIVNSEGYILSPGINIPENAIRINVNEIGEVQAEMPNQIEPMLLGQIELVNFVNQEGLEAIGNNLLKETVSSGQPIANLPGNENVGKILQGFIENSNVNVVHSLTELIKAHRAYEINAKAMQIGSDIWKTVNAIQN